jgi:DNA repair protein RadC
LQIKPENGMKDETINETAAQKTAYKATEEQPNLSIKSWAEDDRPREKLFLRGAKHLSTAELLAILLGSGSRGESAVQLAQRILSEANNNLQQLSTMTIAQLKKYKGMGDAKAITVLAAMEIANRRAATKVEDRPRITSSTDAYNILCAQVADLAHEQFWILLLNRANQVIAKRMVSAGGVAGTVVDAKMVFQPAIEQLASGIILCHNHPSGNLQPSQADIDLTRKLKRGAENLDLVIFDHLILSANGYYSFADEGLL